MAAAFTVSGQFIDIFNRQIFPANIRIENGRIQEVERVATADNCYILPGFVDAHIHIESSMLVPSEFAVIASVHGTVATVSDPHEIANVCGIPGIDYMLENAASSPLKFNFGAPSCVPAVDFETAGAIIGPADIALLLQRKEIGYLAEMMNFPGVLNKDPDVMAKIAAAQKAGKPVDGHGPGLRGANAKAYADAGISTDHECVHLEEALEKIEAGMLILIREGSAARNFDALIGLIELHPHKVMFCSDDKHPDELLKGHINQLVLRALQRGYDLFDVLHAACVLPVMHYQLSVGLLRPGDPADFIVIDHPDRFNVNKTYIDGVLVAENGRSLIITKQVRRINNFSVSEKETSDFALRMPKVFKGTKAKCTIIEAIDEQLITGRLSAFLPVIDGVLHADPDKDLLKIGVVNRYKPAPVAMGFIHNFGIKNGAIASSVAHDSHNIVFVGVDDDSICAAVNGIMKHKGGISVYDGRGIFVMPLPIAGLMTASDPYTTARQYEELDQRAKSLGSGLRSPFMTLSFMALSVIPSLKMTDKGLFDVDSFRFTDVLIKDVAEEN